MKAVFEQGKLRVVAETPFEGDWLREHFQPSGNSVGHQHYGNGNGQVVFWPEQAEKKEG